MLAEMRTELEESSAIMTLHTQPTDVAAQLA